MRCVRLTGCTHLDSDSLWVRRWALDEQGEYDLRHGSKADMTHIVFHGGNIEAVLDEDISADGSPYGRILPWWNGDDY